jgi:exosortase/archaeosortase family protein
MAEAGESALLDAPIGRFVAQFVVLAGAPLAAYYFPYEEGSAPKTAIDGLLRVYALVAGGILRMFDPSVQVVNLEILGAFQVRMVRACGAVDISILLVAAIASWQAPIRRRLIAAAAGIAALAVLNVMRICSLYLVGLWRPKSFYAIDTEVWPVLLLTLSVGFFFVFTCWEPPRTAHS